MKYILFFLAAAFSIGCAAPNHRYASIETPQGSMIVQLSNLTPVHKNNFVQLVQQRYFDTTLFHRVVPGFVIQGGDPDSIFTTPKDTNVLKTQRLLPEYNDALFHKRGALGMGRDDNPLEANFFTQFYIVQGRVWTTDEMDALEKRIGGNFKIPANRREVYRTTGGQPRLDGDYTIFGEVVQGMDVVDAIARVKAVKEMPVQPVTIKVRMLKNRAARKLEKSGSR